MEGNLPQQQCHPASTAVEKDDLVIPVSISVNGLSPCFSLHVLACVLCLESFGLVWSGLVFVSPGVTVDHRLRAFS